MERQNRKDIDFIFDEFYSKTLGLPKMVRIKDESPYWNIGDTEDDRGTIDALFQYYGLDTIRGDLNNVAVDLNNLPTIIFNLIYPIGTVYRTTKRSFNPNTELQGLWELIDDTDNIYLWERVNDTE